VKRSGHVSEIHQKTALSGISSKSRDHRKRCPDRREDHKWVFGHEERSIAGSAFVAIGAGLVNLIRAVD